MTGSSWILVAANAAAASILLFAACAKLVSPQALSSSLAQVTDRPAVSSRAVVRAIGLIETVIALGVLIEPSRLPASVLLAVLSLSFIALGVTGRVRKVDEPCGCFGATSQQPLGNQNIVLGLVIGVVGVANLLAVHPLPDSARAAAPILAATLLGLSCIVTGRAVMQPAKSLPN